MKKAIICLVLLAVFSSGIAQNNEGEKKKKRILLVHRSLV